MQKSNAIEIYTVTLLGCGDRYLLLKRSSSKAFAPGRWTGIGGHVDPGEAGDLCAAAAREVHEEAGISRDELRSFTFRRALFASRPHQPLRLILYFTGMLNDPITPPCPEGELAWKAVSEFGGLDIIETTRPVLDCLVEDMKRDPQGEENLRAGLAVFQSDGVFQNLVWG